MTPVIAIVGRPNVGKSTLFNRLLGRRAAIVQNRPGVTRDRHYGWLENVDKKYLLIDTGGFVDSNEEGLPESINYQVEVAIEEADLIWFLVDHKSGLIPDDKSILKKIRSSGKSFKILCNKRDNENESIQSEFYSLGDEIIPISAAHGIGIDKILSGLPLSHASSVEDESQFKIAIVGRPNVGKSSIVNALIGEDRMVVDSKPGTTRDSVDSYINAHGVKIVLLDTAGIRRHGKREDELESLAVMLVEKRIKNADLVWLVLDISEGITDQDKRIAHMAELKGIPIIVIANKWDLVPTENRETVAKNLPKVWRGAFPSLRDSHIVTISAKNKLRVHGLLELSVKVKCQAPINIPREDLTAWFKGALRKQPPPLLKNKPIIFKRVKQVRKIPPTFLFAVNRPSEIPVSYRRYIAGSMKKRFKFGPYPIKILYRGVRQ